MKTLSIGLVAFALGAVLWERARGPLGDWLGWYLSRIQY